jgi:predicted MFS family arabinose efflux permease
MAFIACVDFLRRPPSALWERRAVAAIFLSGGAGVATLLSRLPDMRTDHALSDGALGNVLFAMTLGLMSSFLFAGKAASKFDARDVVLVSGGTLFSTLALVYFASSTYLLVAFMFAFGLANGALAVAINVLAVQQKQQRGGDPVSTLHGCWSLGMATGAATGSASAIAGVSPSLHVTVAALALMSTCAMAVSLLLRVEGMAPRLVDTQIAPVLPQARQGARRWAPALLCLSSYFVEGAIGDWSTVYLRHELRCDPSTAPLGLTVFFAAVTLMRLSGRLIAVRVRVKRLLRWLNALGAILLGYAVFTPSTVTTIASFAVIGFAVALVVPCAVTRAAVQAMREGRQAGSGVALCTAFGHVGLLTSPLVIGWTSHEFGLRWTFILPGAVLTLIVVLIGYLQDEEGKWG